MVKAGVIAIRPREVDPVPTYCVMVIVAMKFSTNSLGNEFGTFCLTVGSAFHASLPLDVSNNAV